MAGAGYAKYKPYPAYKPSGVEWLGDIPEGWEAKKLKFSAENMPSNIDKKTKPGEQAVKLCNYTDVYYSDVIEASMNFMSASATREQVEKFTLLAGDTIITKDSEDPNDIAIPTFVKDDLAGVVCGYHLSIIRPIDAEFGGYIKRCFECSFARAYFAVSANGLTRYGLGTYPFDNSVFAVPSRVEAIKIAAFLDHETAKIDGLIAKQQRLIALLEEKRQAVISHAVTKGLDPTAPLRPSGIDWLGDVPEHWEVRAIKHSVSTPITDGPHETPNFVDEGIPFVSAEAVSSGKIDFTKIRAHITERDHARFSHKYIPEIGDIFMVKSGATTGKLAIVEDDLVFNIWSPLAAIRCRMGINPRFILHFMRSAQFQEAIRLYWSFGTQQNIGMKVIENLQTVIPPIAEQNEISKTLDDHVSKFDGLFDRAQSAIALLKERRTALISAAVTGKIDLRDWQAPEGGSDISNQDITQNEEALA